jgi:uncharacterized membrane protein YccC
MAFTVTARDIAFVLRCSGAGTLAYALASILGLEHPVWASISGVIVSQEELNQTKNATFWRLAGTIVGILVSVTAGSLTASTGLSVAMQMGLSIALCAAIVRRWPDLKVAMWTAPVLFFARDPSVSLLTIGYWRGSEVVLGGLTGAALHFVSERLIFNLENRAPKPDA